MSEKYRGIGMEVKGFWKNDEYQIWLTDPAMPFPIKAVIMGKGPCLTTALASATEAAIEAEAMWQDLQKDSG